VRGVLGRSAREGRDGGVRGVLRKGRNGVGGYGIAAEVLTGGKVRSVGGGGSFTVLSFFLFFLGAIQKRIVFS
jgi:hypothetical protein